MHLGQTFDLTNGHLMVWEGERSNATTGMNWGQFSLNCLLTGEQQRSAQHIASTLPEKPSIQFQVVGNHRYIHLVFANSLSAGRKVYVSGQFAERFEQEQQATVRQRAAAARQAKPDQNVVQLADHKPKGKPDVNFSHKK